MKVKQIHYYSGITISLFVGIHLFNHFISLYGPSAHIALMDDLRLVYRNILAESILILAVIVQIISGIKLFKQKRKIAAGFYDKLQIWTGLYLAFFLLFHVSAVFAGRFILNLDTNFYFGVAGLNTFPLNLFFIPYYTLAIISFFGHISAVHSMEMKKSILGINPAKQAFGILAIGILSSLIILYGLTNGFKGVEIPAAYDIMTGSR